MVSGGEPRPGGKAASEPTELSLEELMKLEIPTVEGASKYKQKVTEAPSSVTIITSEEVKLYGHRTLADILQSVRGLYVTSDRNYSYLGTRGFNRPGDFNSRILLLVDGHRVNEGIYDGAYIGTEFILDPDLIDRVEVIRGPGSTVYGNNAFFGVVNVVTKRGRDLKTLETSGEYGEFDTSKVRFSYGNQFTNGLELLVSGTYYNSEGPARLFYPEYNTPAQNSGVAQEGDFDRAKSAFGSISYHDFSLEGAYSWREKGVPTGAGGVVFNDPRNLTLDQRGYAHLKFQHEFPEVLDASAQLYYDTYSFEGDSVFDFGLPQLVLNRYLTEAQWWGGELQLRRRLGEHVALTFGAEYRQDFLQKQRANSVDPFVEFPGHDRRTRNHGVYLQGEFSVLTNLVLNAGGRYDQYGGQDPAFTPRLALIYNPIAPTVIKAMYGTAFRAPNFYELINRELSIARIEPETITSYELAIEQSLGTHFRSSASIYYNQIASLIGIAPGGGFKNLTDADSKGAEFEFEGRTALGFVGRASYALQETVDQASGKRLSNSPEHLVKLNFSAPLLKDKLSAGLEVQYVSSRLTLLGRRDPDYWVANVTLFSQKLVKGLDLSASVYNLFNERFGDPGNSSHLEDLLLRDGRSFRVKLTYRF